MTETCERGAGSRGVQQRGARVWCAALLAAVTIARGALAQDSVAESAPLPRAAESTAENTTTAEPTAAQRETARAWVLEGRRAFAEGDHLAALQRFVAAYQLVRAPTVGIEVARARQALGQWVEANATAVEVINLPRAEPEPLVFEQAREAARELLRSLTPRIPALQLQLVPEPADAQLTIDGEPMPFARGAMSFRLNPGSHELRVQAPGYRAELRSVTLAEQEQRVLAVELVMEQPPARELPSAGAEVGTLMAEHAEADPGSGARARGQVALAVAGAATVLGTVTGWLAFSAKPDCPGNVCDPSLRDEADRSRTLGNVATVSFAAGLVAAAYGGWELLFAAPAAQGHGARQPSLRAELAPRADGAQLQLSGAF